MAEKKKLKKPRWIDEFKNFAIKGNALSMAVGVIIGGGFSTITKSLTDDVIMPIVSMFLGGGEFLPVVSHSSPVVWSKAGRGGKSGVQYAQLRQFSLRCDQLPDSGLWWCSGWSNF